MIRTGGSPDLRTPPRKRRPSASEPPPPGGGSFVRGPFPLLTGYRARVWCIGNALQVPRRAARLARIVTSSEPLLDLLRQRGLRMTPQRRAIVAEVLETRGHITPAEVARRVRERVPGVNPSTVYRTLALLEDVGILSHAHLETGAEYHHRADSQHIHLACSSCGADESLSVEEADQVRSIIESRHDFTPDLTHFAIAGLCARCREDQRASA